MTREIKFRGKRYDTGEWVYGSLIVMGSTVRIMSHDLMAHPGWQAFDVDVKSVCTAWSEERRSR